MRMRRARRFNSDVPALPVPGEACHNFLRPHTGLGGLTPAEKAGIRVPGPDKLPTPIRYAAASRFNFARCIGTSRVRAASTGAAEAGRVSRALVWRNDPAVSCTMRFRYNFHTG